MKNLRSLILAAFALLLAPSLSFAQTISSTGGTTVPFAGSCGAVTVSTPCFDLSQTWNAGAVTFTGLKLNVTDTASAAASMLMDLQVAGVSRLQFLKGGQFNGIFTSAAASSSGVRITTDTTNRIAIGLDASDVPHLKMGTGLATHDLFLTRDAANTLAQRNGPTAQTSCLYNTFTDSSNYERSCWKWVSNVAYLQNANAGTGSARLLIPVSGAVAVSALPTCNAGLEGARAGVTDALTPVALGTLTGGGAVHVPAYCNGTNWIVG